MATINASGLIQLTNATAGVVPFMASLAQGAFAQTGETFVSGIQSIGTTAEAFGIGDVASPGWSYFKNLDAEDDVEIGVDDSGFIPFATLKPGEWCIVPLESAPWAESQGAGAVLVQYAVIER